MNQLPRIKCNDVYISNQSLGHLLITIACVNMVCGMSVCVCACVWVCMHACVCVIIPKRDGEDESIFLKDLVRVMCNVGEVKRQKRNGTLSLHNKQIFTTLFLHFIVSAFWHSFLKDTVSSTTMFLWSFFNFFLELPEENSKTSVSLLHSQIISFGSTPILSFTTKKDSQSTSPPN